jgi:hypothetical protein
MCITCSICMAQTGMPSPTLVLVLLVLVLPQNYTYTSGQECLLVLYFYIDELLFCFIIISIIFNSVFIKAIAINCLPLRFGSIRTDTEYSISFSLKCHIISQNAFQ